MELKGGYVMNEKEKNLPEETSEPEISPVEEASVDEALDEIEEKVTTEAEAEEKADAAENAAVVTALDSRLAQKRRRRFGIVATLITLGVVAAAVVLNVLVGVLMNRYPLSIDLTSDSLYGISDETIDYIQSLDQGVAIHVLATKESLTASYDYMDLVQAGKTLDAFVKNSNKITVDYIDLAANPTFAANYPDYDLKAYDVIFESSSTVDESDAVASAGGNVAVLNFSEMFDYSYDENQSLVSSSHVEQSVLNEILYVVSGVRPKIAFINGFGELASDNLQTLIKGNNYEAVDWNLLTEAAPEGTEIAVWFGPENDPDEDTLKKLDTFLAGGGKLLLFTDPYCSSGKQPVLSAFLAEWGLGALDGFAFETDSSKTIGMTEYLPIVEFDDTEYSSGLENSGTYVAFYLARPLEILFESKGDLSTRVLLSLSETSGYHDASLINNYTLQESDIVGNVTVAAESENASTGGKVFFFGSTYSFDSDFLTTSTLSNAEYIVGVLNKLAERGDTITIAPKNLTGEANTMTDSNVIVTSIIFIVVIPLGVLGAGIWMLVRRHRM